MIIAGGAFAVLLVGWALAYEPVTRNLVVEVTSGGAVASRDSWIWVCGSRFSGLR